MSLLEKSPVFSWLTDFYLSHFINWSGGGNAALTELPHAVPFNPFRLNIFDKRKYFWFIGFFLFFSGVVPIYYGKITRRPAVSGGIYRFIRHPQYLGFAILGIPFLVIWPRFILLIAYVSMLFSYYLLARHEEKLCLEKFGRSFQAYLDRTPAMFIPGDRWMVHKLEAAYRTISANGKFRSPVLAAVYLLICVATVSVAYGLKHLTVRLLSQVFTGDSLAIAIQNACNRGKTPGGQACALRSLTRSGRKGTSVSALSLAPR
jgi:Phospholipid methyltransferase